MQITDRAKDVIKSGGEWISSIELENAAVAFPGIHEAAVIGLPHPTWQERPLLVIVPKAGATIDKAALRAHLAQHVARWWLPDDITFVSELPPRPASSASQPCASSSKTTSCPTAPAATEPFLPPFPCAVSRGGRDLRTAYAADFPARGLTADPRSMRHARPRRAVGRSLL